MITYLTIISTDIPVYYFSLHSRCSTTLLVEYVLTKCFSWDFCFSFVYSPTEYTVYTTFLFLDDEQRRQWLMYQNFLHEYHSGVKSQRVDAYTIATYCLQSAVYSEWVILKSLGTIKALQLFRLWTVVGDFLNRREQDRDREMRKIKNK